MKRSGFTLIELLAVIVILGIVVAIAIPGINSVINNSRKKSVLAEAQLLHSAAIRKIASEPSFDFESVNKDNVKVMLEVDNSDYEEVYIKKSGLGLIVGLKKNNYRAIVNGKTEIITSSIPHVAFEFDFSLGAGYLNVVHSDLTSQTIYVYKGSYKDNVKKIENNFSEPHSTLSNITSDVDLRTLISTTGKYTVVLTKFTSTASQYISNRSLIDIPHFDLKELNTTNLTSLFHGAKDFNSDINHWDVSEVTNFYRLFHGASKFNQPLDNWNVSKVTNMNDMFSSATKFNQNINNWDVSNVNAMNWMFSYLPEYNQPLNNWDISKVTGTTYMFFNAKSFDQDITNWDTGNVYTMNHMFSGAEKFNQDLSGWNVSKVPSKPTDFDKNTPAWTKPKPIWGTNGAN